MFNKLTFSFFLNTVQVVDSQYVPKTCQCPQVKQRVNGPLSDFNVSLKGPNCFQDEIMYVVHIRFFQIYKILNVRAELGFHVLLFSVFFIRVTRQKTNRLVCLSPDGPQGKRLLECWQR